MLSLAQLGHNRSSSPSATLADRAKRKVPKHRSRANPTFDQRHDSELMHIMLQVRGAALVKVFRLFTPYCGVRKPLVYWPYQSVWLQGVVNEHIYVKQECNNRRSVMHCLFKNVR